MVIRQEQESDFEQVFQLNLEAFGQDSEAKLVDALRLNSDVFIPELSLVAEDNQQILGHILFTKIQIIHNEQNSHTNLALAPMAVKPGFQKQGIGGSLISKGLEIAKSLGFTSVIVLGHEQYYPKFGFVPAHKFNIKAPFDVPPNAFMAIELVENGLQNIEGMVRYPKEFEAV